MFSTMYFLGHFTYSDFALFSVSKVYPIVAENSINEIFMSTSPNHQLRTLTEPGGFSSKGVGSFMDVIFLTRYGNAIEDHLNSLVFRLGESSRSFILIFKKDWKVSGGPQIFGKSKVLSIIQVRDGSIFCFCVPVGIFMAHFVAG